MIPFLAKILLFQISSLLIPVGYTDGAFVPNRGWIIFGGHTGFSETQQLLSIDGTWKIGDPIYQNDYEMCILQVYYKKAKLVDSLLFSQSVKLKKTQSYKFFDIAVPQTVKPIRTL